MWGSRSEVKTLAWLGQLGPRPRCASPYQGGWPAPRAPSKEDSTTGASIIPNTILGVPDYKYSIMGPKTYANYYIRPLC